MRLLGLAFLCLALACSDSFLPAWAVIDLRVVGGRVEADGQSERARPEPGDEVQVSLLVIDQGAPPSDEEGVPALTPGLLQWSFVACIPQPTLIGTPICRTLIQPCLGCDAQPPEDRLAFPVFNFQAPSEADLEAAAASSVVVQGAICVGGAPEADSILRFIFGEIDDINPCEDPSNEGRFVTVQVPIETTPEDPNLNPEISNVTLNGRSWPPPYDQGVPRDAPREGCVTDLEDLTDEQRALHPVAGPESSAIELTVPSGSLQPYMVGDISRTEEIQVSWLTDGGNLERTFSFITTPANSVLTNWRPFADVPAGGALVRFNFVIRDGRGGTDWVERGLCVLPAPAVESPP